jgi:hypothetical protein
MSKFFILASLFTLILAGSCSRNHTCACTSTYSGADTNWVSTEDIIIEKMSEKKAKQSCEEMSRSSTLLTETRALDCKLE